MHKALVAGCKGLSPELRIVRTPTPELLQAHHVEHQIGMFSKSLLAASNTGETVSQLCET